jgi:hypothetical protein
LLIGFGIFIAGISGVLLTLALSWFIDKMFDPRDFIFSLINASITIVYFITFGTFVYGLLA